MHNITYTIIMLYTLYLLIITCFTAVKNDLRRMQMCTCCRAGRAIAAGLRVLFGCRKTVSLNIIRIMYNYVCYIYTVPPRFRTKKCLCFD